LATPRLTCTCCGYVTLPGERGGYDICPICFWEDDPVQFANPSLRGGANPPSLVEAQRGFADHGVGETRMAAHVRPPSMHDVPDVAWRPFRDGDFIHDGNLSSFDDVAYWMRPHR
jgi:hypothetical protein